ncbi:MAG: hypothetical protein K2M82_06580 [Lachnospiraceae bacterium]|nr:hypothetical protein [Lachnospiraceae bacterium]
MDENTSGHGRISRDLSSSRRKDTSKISATPSGGIYSGGSLGIVMLDLGGMEYEGKQVYAENKG